MTPECATPTARPLTNEGVNSPACGSSRNRWLHRSSLPMSDEIEEVEHRIGGAAEALDFELARRLRDQINLILRGSPADEAAVADTTGLTSEPPGLAPPCELKAGMGPASTAGFPASAERQAGSSRSPEAARICPACGLGHDGLRIMPGLSVIVPRWMRPSLISWL